MGLKDIISFIFVFSLSCTFSFYFTVDENLFKIGKSITVKNRILKQIFSFPLSIFAKIKSQKFKVKKEANVFGIILYCINYIILIGSCILQFLPTIPCEAINISFGPRYRLFRFSADTYNQKIPILSIWVLLFIQVLIMLVKLVLAAITTKGAAKKIGIGAIIFFIVIILLNIVILSYFTWLLLQ